MTQKEVIRKIVNLLNPELETFNFKANLKEQGFIRRDENAVFFYFFLIYDRTNVKTGERGFLIEPHANINIPMIEKYYKEITLNSFLKTEWDFITIGNSIAELRANPDGIARKINLSLDLIVFEEEHIQSVVRELINQFKEVALPYFLANSTVKKVDELLNKHPREYSVHMINDLFRFVKGLIAAKLNNNPRLDELFALYSNLIVERDMAEDCIEEMERLKRLLPEIN